MTQFPGIDIIVPTFNRSTDIAKFIKEIQKQTYPNLKVFIIDDHGEKSVEHLISKEDDHFYFERLDQNKGQAYVRNYALKKGNAPIVIFMDDDAWFLENDALFNVVDYFKLKPDMGCLMFDINEPERNWLSERYRINDLQEIGEFIACGAAFKREAIENIGGFSDFLHSYGEESDMAMRLIQRNFKLYFGKKIKLYHNYQPGERDSKWFKRFKFHSVRNDLLIVLMRYPSILIIPYFWGKFFSHLVFNIKNEKQFIVANIQVIKALLQSFILIPKALKLRDPISIEKFNYWKRVRF